MRYSLHHRIANAVLVFGLQATVVRAIEPPPVPARTSDAELTRRVQTVLSADSVLRNRSLVISVVDGVAVVGGPVASTAESDRIGQLLRVVPELTDVKISAWVPAVDDPLKKRIADRLNGGPVVAPVNRLVSGEPRPAARVTVQRYEPAAPAVALLGDPQLIVAPTPTRADSAYSPLPAPAPAAPDGPPEFPTIPPPSVPVLPGQDVESAIEGLRRVETRYAGLTVKLRSGTVEVGGTAAAAEDAWNFIAQVRKVPGVDRVLLGRLDLP